MSANEYVDAAIESHAQSRSCARSTSIGSELSARSLRAAMYGSRSSLSVRFTCESCIHTSSFTVWMRRLSSSKISAQMQVLCSTPGTGIMQAQPSKDILAAGKDRIVYVQAADAPKLPPDQIKDNERLMPGEGVIDFNAFFGALKKIGYNGGVSPEVFGRGLKDIPPEEGAKLGLKTTTEVMRKAGVL